MIYTASMTAVAIFMVFVAITLGLSFYFARKTSSAQSYFAAGGQIHWFVNGVAFAGDYLSAASFLGICGMIAFSGYDGFLYSIGYLAGWIVALLVVAEPLKRLGKYTFADALDAKFRSPGIKLAAGVSTLVVSLFYLIPQMVGAGVLVKPLLGFGHATGVCLVGAVVVLIVVTAGMVSTTYVQFLKGSLLVVFSTILTVAILNRGFQVPDETDANTRPRISEASGKELKVGGIDMLPLPPDGYSTYMDFASSPDSPVDPFWERDYYRFTSNSTGETTVWKRIELDGRAVLIECQTVAIAADGRKLVNGKPWGNGPGEADLFPVGSVSKLPGDATSTGPLGPLSYLSTLEQSTVLLWAEDKRKITDEAGNVTTVYYPKPTAGSEVLLPGNSSTFAGLRKPEFVNKLNFLSLMLALFCGTASLPHILIRYYTVKDQAAARKSTVVGIAAIGFFYVLTLYIGLGAMTGGTLDVTNSNMAAPLLARGFGELLFACISAIAFTTVLGTVAGLIVAAAGAIVHDLLTGFLKMEMSDHDKVRVGRIGAVGVGLIAIVLGILFEKLNVTFLVGWAFSVAASANMPSLAMLLFWRGTTRQGIIAGILVGMVSSLGWVLLSTDAFKEVYGLNPDLSPMPFSQPGIVTIPLGFATVIVVSLLTFEKCDAKIPIRAGKRSRVLTHFLAALGTAMSWAFRGTGFGVALCFTLIISGRYSFFAALIAIPLFSFIGFVGGALVGMLGGRRILEASLKSGKGSSTAGALLAALGTDGVDPLLRSLNHPDAAVKAAALRGLYLLPIETLPMLIRRMATASIHDAIEKRILAFGQEAVPDLEAALETASSAVAIQAARILTELVPNSELAVACYRRLLSCGNALVELQAAKVVVTQEPGHIEANERVRNMLSNHEIMIRYAALRAVCDGGFVMEMMRESLVDLTHFPDDGDVRRLAREALNKE